MVAASSDGFKRWFVPLPLLGLAVAELALLFWLSPFKAWASDAFYPWCAWGVVLSTLALTGFLGYRAGTPQAAFVRSGLYLSLVWVTYGLGRYLALSEGWVRWTGEDHVSQSFGFYFGGVLLWALAPAAFGGIIGLVAQRFNRDIRSA